MHSNRCQFASFVSPSRSPGLWLGWSSSSRENEAPITLDSSPNQLQAFAGNLLRKVSRRPWYYAKIHKGARDEGVVNLFSPSRSQQQRVGLCGSLLLVCTTLLTTAAAQQDHHLLVLDPLPETFNNNNHTPLPCTIGVLHY